jgi:hypothetical protein
MAAIHTHGKLILCTYLSLLLREIHISPVQQMENKRNYTEWLFESLSANRLADPTLETQAPTASPSRASRYTGTYLYTRFMIALQRRILGDTVPQLRTHKMRVVTMAYIHPAGYIERFSVGFHIILLYFGDSEINYAVGTNVIYST